ncbi:hypothetical protein MFIFM68171_04987 [Madurella fahalii]|uniref:Uncharacterized protein n=1 Tax=Madurella fahalii TaxID=1157608 RepID=A0ABQ0GAI1_9PEZI
MCLFTRVQYGCGHPSTYDRDIDDCPIVRAQIAAGYEKGSITPCSQPADPQDFDYPKYREKCPECYKRYKKEMEARFDAEWDFRVANANADGQDEVIRRIDEWMEAMDQQREASIEQWEADSKIIDQDPTIEYDIWLEQVFQSLDTYVTELTRQAVNEKETGLSLYDVQPSGSLGSGAGPARSSSGGSETQSLARSRQRREQRERMRARRRELSAPNTTWI